jgi:hypothetical protein
MDITIHQMINILILIANCIALGFSIVFFIKTKRLTK